MQTKIYGAMVACVLCLAATPLAAQTQIGGGTCSSASLNGTYSLTLSGRDVNSSLTFTKVLQGIGTATFDGLSKVTFSLTNNTNQTSGVAQMWSGTYSLQANCAGVLNLASGDTASFSLESYNSGKSYLITGQDGTYTFTGSGSLVPTAACSASLLSGSYSFNGSGFALTSSAVSGGNNVSGLLQFDGKGAVTANWSVAASRTSVATNATGTYAVTSSCLANAMLTDSSGNTWTLQFAVTAANGSNFIVSGATPLVMFIGGGRTETTTAPCSVATLSGHYSLVLTGRNLTAFGVLAGTFQGIGSATFDGAGNVTFTLATNNSQMLNVPETLPGAYTVGSNCTGTLNTSSGDVASFTLIAYNAGKNFTITGGDSTYALSGGGAVQPVSCGTSAVSGTYAFSGSGNTGSVGMGSGSISLVSSISGLLQFDGRGDISGSWTVATNGTATPDTVSGQYSVAAPCLGTATVADPSGASWTLHFTATSADGSNIGVDIANATGEFSATGHSSFTYPGLAVVNASSSAAGGTPPGSIFAIYGSGLATASAQPAKLPLPTTLLTTSVTVNSEAAPLFYVGDGQINAQMPWDIQPGVVSVVVKNGSFTSNTVAVTVPATAVPGIAVQYPTNQAVVVNQDFSENTPASPAHVGDTVVAYFTGGGPVTAAGPLVTGSASPNGLSWVVGGAQSVQVMVGGQVATAVNYAGLTPTLVGCYQVNFVIPQVAAGSRNLILTIDGTASVVTTISIAN
jgi:uncharacterized protein (TIGR03437 family)